MWLFSRRRAREEETQEEHQLQSSLLHGEDAPAGDEEHGLGARAESHAPASSESAQSSDVEGEGRQQPATLRVLFSPSLPNGTTGGGAEQGAEQAAAAAPPRREVDRVHLGRHIIRAVVHSQFWLFFIIFFRLAQAVTACVVLLDLASLPSASPAAPEQCDNGRLLRTWLGVYAARCVALSATLWSAFRLSRAEAVDDFDGAFAHEELTLRRIQCERTKLWLNSFGTLWAVLGAMWILGSADCPARAPILSGTVLVFLLLSALGMALPLLIFSLLCCCLPTAMLGLSTFGEQLGIVPDSDEQGEDFSWIDRLPAHHFSTALPLDRLRAAANPAAARGAADEAGGAASSGGGGAGASSSSADAAAAAAAGGGDEELGEGGDDAGAAGTSHPPGGGWVGKRRLEEEDASCCICIGEYTDGAAVRILPACSHHFHQQCIDTWLRVNASCPLCKALVGPAAEAAAALAAAAEQGDEEAPAPSARRHGGPFQPHPQRGRQQRRGGGGGRGSHNSGRSGRASRGGGGGASSSSALSSSAAAGGGGASAARSR